MRRKIPSILIFMIIRLTLGIFSEHLFKYPLAKYLQSSWQLWKLILLDVFELPRRIKDRNTVALVCSCIYEMPLTFQAVFLICCPISLKGQFLTTSLDFPLSNFPFKSCKQLITNWFISIQLGTLNLTIFLIVIYQFNQDFVVERNRKNYKNTLIYFSWILDFENTSLHNETNSYGPTAPTDAPSTTAEALSDGNPTTLTATELKQTTASSPSNFLELTTEKLSLTDKSLLSSRLVSESLTSSSTIATNNSTNNHSLSNSSSSTHHSKSTSKQRTSSNSVVKSSGGGMRISGQKIEMPQLNDFFDHSAYLKLHEHGFRWVFVQIYFASLLIELFVDDAHQRRVERVATHWWIRMYSWNLLNIPNS